MPVPAEQITALLTGAVDTGTTPGAVWATGGPGGQDDGGAVGLLDPGEPAAPARPDSIYDLASLTKVLAVWSVLGTLWDEGAFALDNRLEELLPDTGGHPLGRVSVHHLFTHTAGLPLRSRLRELYGTDPETIRAGVLHEQLHRAPGEAVEYTDRAALVLGYLAEHLGGTRLDVLARDRVWGPLGMDRTRFGPLPEPLEERTAPTEENQDTGKRLRGIAHDFSARLLGGVCGIAGAFGPAADLGRFLTHMLAPEGRAPSERWVKESLRIQTRDLAPERGLFWHPADLPGVWGHNGFTGTGMWLDPAQGRWAVLLTNKLYFTRDRGPISELRARFCEAAFS